MMYRVQQRNSFMRDNIDIKWNISFAERYGLAAELYAGISVDSLPFSVRATKRFINNGITSVQSLLETSPQELMSWKGFGKTCLDEVESYCLQLCDAQSNVVAHSGEDHKKASTFLAYAKSIAIGDFSFAETCALTEKEQEQLACYRRAFEILGKELVFDCIVAPDKIAPIKDAIQEFQLRMNRFLEVTACIDALSPLRRNNRAYPYILAFTADDQKRETLQSFCSSDETPIQFMVNSDSLKDDIKYILFLRFLKWLKFDIESEINDLFKKVYKNDRAKLVIQGRARKLTLEQIGTEIGVTRERVRQIEAKVKKTFSRLYSRIRVVSKVSAEHNGNQLITPSNIEEYCGQNAKEFLYLLKSYENGSFTYDRQLDVFVLGDGSIQEQITMFVEKLPEIVKVEQLPEILAVAKEDEGITSDMLEKAFLDAYRITGRVYHRYRLSLAKIYEKMMDKYYPDGLKVYDAEEIAKFRSAIAMEFGDVNLPKNDRALAARIASICVLCGRGVYKLKQKRYISKELEEKIHKYITESSAPIFMTNTLYSVFEDELNAYGIKNKYYLQGVLHELFGDEFIFRRDYVSKNADVTSVYSEIIGFIKQSEYPVSKNLIQKKFPGISEIVINFAVSDNDIINYFGEYLHACHLRITDAEKQYLHGVLQQQLSDGQGHHSKDIYEIIVREKPEIFTKNSVLFQFSSFSVLENLFREDFQFSRPYIALNGVDIGRAAERLHDLVYSSNELTIAEINGFAKDNYYQIQSILEFINSCNDEFLLINASTIMRISDIGITEEMAENIEQRIAEIVDRTMPIYELEVWNALPKLIIPWTDWLLYSVLNKWGKKLSVATSSNQFRQSVPLVAPVGMMDEAEFLHLTSVKHDNSIKIDNLDDIDTLLEDILDDDIWEEDI